MMWNLQSLSNNSNERMWHFRGQNTLWPSYIFQWVKTPKPQDLHVWHLQIFSFFIFTARQFQQSTIVLCQSSPPTYSRKHAVQTSYKRAGCRILTILSWRCCGLRPGIRTVPYRNAPVHTGSLQSIIIKPVLKMVMWSRLTWRSQVGANLIPIPHPTNLALFGHKIALYRFNQGSSYYCRGSNRSRGLSPPPGPLTLTTA